MLVGIKYCGGCRASFDRVAEADRTVEAVKGAGETAGDIYFTNAEEGEIYDVLLAVCGCRSVCPDLSPFTPVDIIYINEEGDAAKAAGMILEEKNVKVRSDL